MSRTGKPRTSMPALKTILEDLTIFQVRNSTILSGKRVVSVDALRGFDMFWIMGGDLAFKGLDNIFHCRISGFIKTQMDHVDWFGFHFYDIIMPLFLFLVGVSMVYSYRKRLSQATSDRNIWKHTIQRVLILWILGMVVQGNLLSYDIDKIHFYTNTLQAIAAGYLIATVFVLYLPVTYQILATVGLLTVYWAIIALVPVGGNTLGAYDPDGNVAMFVEKSVMGRFIGWGSYTWIVSTLNFGATVMLGVFSGYMMQARVQPYRKFLNFLVYGLILVALGLIIDLWHPIIKKIWTSSFVLFSGGICVLLLGIFYLFIDVWGLRKGIRWLIILGSNAIFGYVAWHLFGNNLVGMAEVLLKGLNQWIESWFDTLRYFGGFVFIYLLMWYMYRNKTFIKI
jgi:predicted acyltransferase